MFAGSFLFGSAFSVEGMTDVRFALVGTTVSASMLLSSSAAFEFAFRA
jgi:hypothetical protein